MSYAIVDPTCPPDIACYQCKRPLIPEGAELVEVHVTGIDDETGAVIPKAGSTFATAMQCGAFLIYLGGIKHVERPTLFCKRCRTDWCLEVGYFEHPLPNKEKMEDLRCGIVE